METLLNSYSKRGKFDKNEMIKLCDWIYQEDKINEISIICLMLEKVFEEGVLNINMFLEIAISELKNYEGLYLIAIILRKMKNTNIYVNTQEYGEINIYVYTVLSLQSNEIDPNIITIVLQMLLLVGTLPTNFAFKNKIETIKNDYDDSLIFEKSENRATPIKTVVNDWLQKNGFDILPSKEQFLKDNKDKSTVKRMGLWLDDISIYSENSLETLDLQNIFKCRSNKIMIDSINRGLIDNEIINGEHKLLKECVAYVNYPIFNKAIDYFDVSYFTVTRLILEIKYSNSTGNIIVETEYKNMLLKSIDYGAPIDSSQLDLLSSQQSNADFVMNIKNRYNKPIWEKSCCSTLSHPSQNIRKYALNLNVNDVNNKKEICETFRKVTKNKEHTINMNMQKRRNGISNITDKPISGCSNISPHNDFFDYSNTNMSYYLEDDKLWCFLCDSYTELLETHTNKYTGKKLPTQFETEISFKLKILKDLGIPSNDPKTVSETLDTLTKNDEISNKESIYIMNTIYKIIELSYINYPKEFVYTDKISKLDNSQLNDILAKIDIEQDILLYKINDNYILSKEVTIFIFVRAVDYAIRSSENKMESQLSFVNAYRQVIGEE